MNMSRRTFLGLAGAASAALLTEPAAAASATAADDAVGVLVDTTRCVGCRSCEMACSEANGLAEPEALGEDSVFDARRTTDTSHVTVVNRNANPRDPSKPRFVKTQCLHCLEPACASACPVKAMDKTPEGPVVYHADRCIGCRYCMVACPFGVPKFQYEKARPIVRKCTLCAGRLREGKPPACAEACPTGTLTFGKRRDLLETARRRVYGTTGVYTPAIYGEREAGGTSWLYISDLPFEKLGLRTEVGTTPYPELTRPALSVVPLLLTVAPPLLMGLVEFSRRREQESLRASDKQETRHE